MKFTTILLLLQTDLPIPSIDDTKDVKSLLTWIIGILLIASAFVIRHFLVLTSERFKDKNDQINKLQEKLDTEITYGKEQGLSTVRMISDNNNVLKTLVKSCEALNIDMTEEVKPILKDNNKLIEEIKQHQIK